MLHGNGLVFNVHGSGELRHLLPTCRMFEWCYWLGGEPFASLDLVRGVSMLNGLKWAALNPPPQLAYRGLLACDQVGLACTECGLDSTPVGSAQVASEWGAARPWSAPMPAS